MANRQNGKLSGHFPLFVLVVALFAALSVTFGMLGYVLGKNAGGATGKLVDTIVLSPGESNRQSGEAVHYLSGRLLVNSGDPFFGATVELRDTGISDVTDGQGKFYLSDVRTGAHRLQVRNSAGETVSDMELELDFSGGVAAEFGKGYASLSMPQDVRLVEFTLTIDGGELQMDENSAYFVTKSGTIVDFGGGALTVKDTAVAVLPNVDVVASDGSVLLPARGTVITPTGQEAQVSAGEEVFPGVTVAEDGAVHISKEDGKKPTAGPSAGDNEEPPVGSEPSTGDNEAPTENSKPSTGGNEEPPVSSEPSTGGNEEPPVSSEPPAGDNEEPPVSSEPYTGDNEEPPVSSEPPAGDNEEPPVSSEPSAGDNEEPPVSSEPPAGDNEEPPEVGEPDDGDIVITPDGEITTPDDNGGQIGDDVIIVEDGTVETVPELPEEYVPPEDAVPEPGDAAVPGDAPADGAAGEADQADSVQTGGLQVFDTKTAVSWKQQSIIDLFKNRTTGILENDEDGTPLAEPGSSGYYEFRLENPEDYDIAYTIAFEELSFHLPIRYSVIDGRTNYSYLYRERIESPEEPLVSGELVLAAHSEQTFRIEWDWMHEDWYYMELDDATDLAAARRQDRTYILSVTLNAAEIVKEPEENSGVDSDVEYDDGDTRYPGKH